MKILVTLSLLASMAMAGPTVYKIDQQEGTAEKVMTPVSSTGKWSTFGVVWSSPFLCKRKEILYNMLVSILLQENSFYLASNSRVIYIEIYLDSFL